MAEPAAPPMPTTSCAADPREFSGCEASTDFAATNGTGCCLQRNAWVAGVCDPCAATFTCPKGPSEGFQWGALVAIVVNVGISVGMALQKHTLTVERYASRALGRDPLASGRARE